jgi:hypothetical protein
MTQNDLDLAQRITRLERQNRRMRFAGLAAMGVTGVALLASASAVCKTVWAERFVLRDSSNRERAVLTAYETGGPPKLSLLDEKGEAALTFGVGENGVAYLELPGENGVVRREILPSTDVAPKKAIQSGDDEVAMR